jgi:predicted permease
VKVVALLVVAAALAPTAAHARRRERADPLTITGALLMSAGVAALGSAAAFHVVTRRANERFEATFQQHGPTGFSTTTWADAIEYRRRAERLGVAAAISYGFAVLAVPIGAALVATGVNRSRRAHLAPTISTRGIGATLRLEF